MQFWVKKQTIVLTEYATGFNLKILLEGCIQVVVDLKSAYRMKVYCTKLEKILIINNHQCYIYKGCDCRVTRAYFQ